MNENLRYIDLFAGAGGLSEGFIREGFVPVTHLEMGKDACDTLRTRLAYHHLRLTNNLNPYYSYLKKEISRNELWDMIPREIIQSVLHEEITSQTIGNIFQQIDERLDSKIVKLIIGGPPCQAYSLIGRSRDPNRMNGDKRNYLFRFYGEFLNRYKPEFFVFENLFGKIVLKCNYKELEKRDMEKPVRREDLSISPRLAKIMINLSEVKEDGTLLDAFCGIGVILMESLSMGVKAIGIDRDDEAIEGARKNIAWLNVPRDKWVLMNNDSSKVVMGSVDTLVSEPDFGETLRKTPNEREAKKMIDKSENLIISVVNNLKKSVMGKMVLTLPFISTGRERVGCDTDRILSKTGLKMEEGFPIKEFREGQIVGREIIVLKK